MDISYQIVNFFYHLSLITWLGGIITISFLVAPTVFGALPSRNEAGNVMTQIFRKFQVLVLVSMVILLISSMIKLRIWENAGLAVVLRYLFMFAMVVLACFHSSIVSRKIRVLRASIPSFDDVAPGDPRRQAFSRWHRISVALTLMILLAGLATLFVS